MVRAIWFGISRVSAILLCPSSRPKRYDCLITGYLMARVNCALDRSIKQHSLREIDFPFFFRWFRSTGLMQYRDFLVSSEVFCCFWNSVAMCTVRFSEVFGRLGVYIAGMFFIVTCSVPNLPLVMCSFRKVYVLISLCNLCFTILIVSIDPVQHTFMFPLTSFYCRNRVQPNQLM